MIVPASLSCDPFPAVGQPCSLTNVTMYLRRARKSAGSICVYPVPCAPSSRKDKAASSVPVTAALESWPAKERRNAGKTSESGGGPWSTQRVRRIRMKHKSLERKGDQSLRVRRVRVPK